MHPVPGGVSFRNDVQFVCFASGSVLCDTARFAAFTLVAVTDQLRLDTGTAAQCLRGSM